MKVPLFTDSIKDNNKYKKNKKMHENVENLPLDWSHN